MQINDPNASTQAHGLADTTDTNVVDAATPTDISIIELVGEPTDWNFIPARSVFKRPSKPAVTILLIGETGTGKTTFMSLLVNLFQGRTVFELEDMHDDCNESGLSKIASQTTKATLYTATTSDGFILNILDTPGLADTRGVEQDEQHKAEINKAIKEFVISIDAVLVMANGTVQRLSPSTAYTLSIITTIFPHTIIDNIGLVLTHAEETTLNFETESLPPQLRQSQRWVIQNPLAMVKKYRSENIQAGPESTKMAWKRKLEASYHETIHTLDNWLAWLDERESKPTKEIHDIYEKSVGIESSIAVAVSSIALLATKRVEWEKISSELNAVTSIKRDAQAAILQQQEAVVWKLKESQDYNVICMQEDCHSNCRSPRLERMLKSRPWSYGAGMCVGALPALTVVEAGWATACALGLVGALGGVGVVGAAVWLFWRNSKCEGCSHSAIQHHRAKVVYVPEPGKADPNTIKAFEGAKTMEERLNVANDIVRGELNQIQVDTDKIQATLRDLIIQYNQISLSGSFTGHIRSVIHMLEIREQVLRKTGAEVELKLVGESIAKLQKKLNFLEEEIKAAEDINRQTLTINKGFYKSVVQDSNR